MLRELRVAERRAWGGLAKRNYSLFGFYAALWSQLASIWRRVSGETVWDPFNRLVDVARQRYCLDCDELKDDRGAHLCPKRIGSRPVELG
jgi:hypothetical protein